MAMNVITSHFDSFNYTIGGMQATWHGYYVTETPGGEFCCTEIVKDSEWCSSMVCFKYTTPAFKGVSEYLKFTFPNSANGTTYPEGVITTLRFYLCTSDNNKDNYLRSFNPYDANQISQEDIIISTYSNYKMNISVKFENIKLNENTTYYLFVRKVGANDSYKYYLDYSKTPLVDPTVELGYNDGVVHINNDIDWGEYISYIDNGTSWDIYMPYIDNGIIWEPL